MKAILYRKYGTPEVLEMKEVEKPIPQKNEVLIKIHATSVTTADTMMRRADSFISRIILGLGKPKKKYRILGIEFAGEIESLGPGGTKYRRGDRVYGFSGFSAGCYAEYLCVGEKSSLAIKPANLNFQEAVSMVDGASTADFFLRDKAKYRKEIRF
ncbi:MAG: alcohol dehydrogenase catalytic domain-containing protein [Spirochaetaceae bacterium]|jgi:NADPH:quinone reductase-like Zn-dependent oxidoreductase|nr:alcohol dehydrogenase catalytic domain-containing protein [Spirochaetaceae bacterium]